MRGGLPVGDGSAFDDKPRFARARAHEFVDQTGFSYAGFAPNCDDLTPACRGTLPCCAELRDLGVASNKPHQAPCCCNLQPGAHPLRPGDLIGFDRLVQPLYVELAEGFDLDVPLGQAQGRAANEDRAGYRRLLHASREMNGRPTAM